MTDAVNYEELMFEDCKDKIQNNGKWIREDNGDYWDIDEDSLMVQSTLHLEMTKRFLYKISRSKYAKTNIAKSFLYDLTKIINNYEPIYE